MPSPERPDRRRFLLTLGPLAGGTLLASSLPAVLATMDLACKAEVDGAPFKRLLPEDVRFVRAVASRIIPSDHRPGAAEAGVVRFIDAALESMGPFAGAESEVRRLAVRLEQLGGRPFEEAPDNEQDLLLAQIESDDAFELIRMLTVAGFLVHPSRGGNASRVGWQLIGFEDRHAWKPPFGYYDAAVHPGDPS